MTIGRNSKTVMFIRDNRFLIDDYESPLPIAYRLTKPLKIGRVHNGHGAYKFVLTEVALDPDDNYELNIPDYYKYFDKDGNPIVISTDDRLKQDPVMPVVTPPRYCSIECDERVVYNSLGETEFTAYFSGVRDGETPVPLWNIECDFTDKLLVREDGNSIYISSTNKKLTNKSFTLSVEADDFEKTSIIVEIKALI